MSKETRTIRPYVGLDSLSGVLDQSLLHFGTDACEADASLAVQLSERDFLLRPVTLSWASDAQAFEGFVGRLANGASEAEIPIESLSLGVVARSNFLQYTDVLVDEPLSTSHDLDRSIVLSDPPRPRSLSTPFNGFVVDAYLYLNTGLDAKPLRPHVKGTWLSRARYRVVTSLGPAVLPPTPLTEEVRRTYDLPAKTVRYIHMGDHNLLLPFRDSEQPILYVDEDLLGQLNARSGSAASKSIQTQIALDFISAIVRRAPTLASELRSMTYQDLSESLLGSMVRLAAGSGASDADRDLLVGKLVNDPEYVIARAEHAIGVGDSYNRALKENGS